MRSVEEKFSLLLVDDEPPMLRMLAETFAGQNYRIYLASDAAEALELLARVGIDAVLTDLVMPEMDGLELLKRIRKNHPAVMVMILTGQGDIKAAVNAIKLGADDFLEKPFAPDSLRLRVAQIHKMWRLKQENRELRESLQRHQFSFPKLVGNSTRLLELKEMIVRAGKTDSTVLIEGETGTGKELVARALHHHSHRSTQDFVPVDCAAISATVIENELFGHVRGAFTGADAATPGLIRSADGGTLFLDEIGELPLPIQVKLLRVLQEREVRPVGSSRAYPVDVRILAATNRDLKRLVKRGGFRADLFYRINVLTLDVPPLRDRIEDVPLLAKFFLQRFETELSPVKTISREALACLENYSWPGNIRELENIIQRAVAIGGAGAILPEDLPPELSGRMQRSSSGPNLPSEDSMEAFEIAAIKRALTKSAGNRPKAARLLGIGQATLYRKINKYGIDS